jgi:hypothetical protein
MKSSAFASLVVVCVAALTPFANSTHANVHLWVADDERSANGPNDGSDNGNGPDISEAPERPLPERSTVADIDPALRGAEHDGVEGETALGPQYRLNADAELGGTTEKSDVSAMTTNPDADRYTFGLRMTF